MTFLKQVILVRTDINMSKGKVAAQVAHAAVDATLSANKKLVSKWRSTGMKKITLKAESEEGPTYPSEAEGSPMKSEGRRHCRGKAKRIIAFILIFNGIREIRS